MNSFTRNGRAWPFAIAFTGFVKDEHIIAHCIIHSITNILDSLRNKSNISIGQKMLGLLLHQLEQKLPEENASLIFC